jgi:hypothetical protein
MMLLLIAEGWTSVDEGMMAAVTTPEHVPMFPSSGQMRTEPSVLVWGTAMSQSD